MIHFSSQDTSLPALDEKRMRQWMRAVAADYGFSIGEIHYVFCSDERELEVNRQFLQHDYYTDTITFSYSSEHVLSGDIFISVDTVRSNAEMIGTSFERELMRVMIHSLLHLTGQEDKTPDKKAEMTQKEELALSKLT